MIAQYADFSEISMALRPVLHPMFKALAEGISEFTFANIYLFREVHNYRVSQLADGQFVIAGRDGVEPFFMLPFGLPDESILSDLFDRYRLAKALSETQAEKLAAMGFRISQDRDNFDYLYSRADLVNLTGRKFHKKKNLLNMFVKKNECQARPLLEEYRDDAMEILEGWKRQHDGTGDFAAAKEALE